MADKDTRTRGRQREEAAATLGADKHGEELQHGHAPYPSRADLDRRLEAARGDQGGVTSD
jgi:hypothetical protein